MRGVKKWKRYDLTGQYNRIEEVLKQKEGPSPRACTWGWRAAVLSGIKVFAQPKPYTEGGHHEDAQVIPTSPRKRCVYADAIEDG